PWPAQWISYPSAPIREYGVFHFRKTFSLKKKPDHFIVHVSGDTRYRLFLNGRYVCDGPARGDLAHWRFETLDLADQLKAGENLLAAMVWNYGDYQPWNQFSVRTAFVLQGDGEAESIVNTGSGWKVVRNDAYTAIPERGTVAGPYDRLDGAKFP